MRLKPRMKIYEVKKPTKKKKLLLGLCFRLERVRDWKYYKYQRAWESERRYIRQLRTYLDRLSLLSLSLFGDG